MNSLYEKIEIAVGCYAKTFDKGLAYKKAGFTDADLEELAKDTAFQSRLDYFLILEKERLVEALEQLTKSEDEKIKLKAVLEYGKLVYSDFFKQAEEASKNLMDPQEVEDFFNDESNR